MHADPVYVPCLVLIFYKKSVDFNPTMNVIEPSVGGMCALSDYQRSSLIYGVTRKELGGSHAPQICTTSKDFHVHH